MTDLISWEVGGQRNILIADCVVTFRLDATATVTENPVEDGTKIADHVIVNNTPITIEIVQTQTPVDDLLPKGWELKEIKIPTIETSFSPRGLLALTTAIGSLFSGKPKNEALVVVYSRKSPKDRIGEIQDKLLSILEGKYPISVSFRGKVYSDLILTGVGMTLESPGSASFKLEAVSFRTAETKTTTLKIAKKKGADKGKKPPVKPKDVKKSTFAYKEISELYNWAKPSQVE